MTIIVLITSDKSSFVTDLTVQFKFNKVRVNEAERQESREVKFFKTMMGSREKAFKGVLCHPPVHCTDACVFIPVMLPQTSLNYINFKTYLLYNLRLDKQRSTCWL